MYLFQAGKFPDVGVLCQQYIDVSACVVHGYSGSNTVISQGILLTTPISITEVECWVQESLVAKGRFLSDLGVLSGAGVDPSIHF